MNVIAPTILGTTAFYSIMFVVALLLDYLKRNPYKPVSQRKIRRAVARLLRLYGFRRVKHEHLVIRSSGYKCLVTYKGELVVSNAGCSSAIPWTDNWLTALIEQLPEAIHNWQQRLGAKYGEFDRCYRFIGSIVAYHGRVPIEDLGLMFRGGVPPTEDEPRHHIY